MTFYRCEHCGNIIAHIQDSGVRCHCCGEEMKPLTPNTTDAAGEKGAGEAGTAPPSPGRRSPGCPISASRFSSGHLRSPAAAGPIRRLSSAYTSPKPECPSAPIVWMSAQHRPPSPYTLCAPGERICPAGESAPKRRIAKSGTYFYNLSRMYKNGPYTLHLFARCVKIPTIEYVARTIALSTPFRGELYGK